MKTFKIEVRETLARVIEIEANNMDEAEDMVQEMYDNEEIVLDSSDYVDTEIETLGNSEGNEYV